MGHHHQRYRRKVNQNIDIPLEEHYRIALVRKPLFLTNQVYNHQFLGLSPVQNQTLHEFRLIESPKISTYLPALRHFACFPIAFCSLNSLLQSQHFQKIFTTNTAQKSRRNFNQSPQGTYLGSSFGNSIAARQEQRRLAG